jgi:imidazolonepropionase-like amidohydrolase
MENPRTASDLRFAFPSLRPWLSTAAVLLVAAAPVLGQSTRAITGATLIDGTGAEPIPDAVLVIRGGRVVCAGTRRACTIPAGADRTDARGTWILPGLIDAHVHFSQTGWFDGRPDAADLRDKYPYPQVVAGLQAHPERFFRSYLCSGITSVFDVGGYPWTWAMRDRGAGDAHAPRIAAAGPLFATIDFWLNLPAERQFIYLSDDSTVRAAVRTHAAFRTDAVKIWYIMPPQPPDTARVQRLVRATVEETHRLGVRVIVHATGLWEAKDAIRAGADVLVHSVDDHPVDAEFVELARSHNVVYITTLMVGEGYLRAGQGTVDGRPYPLDCADSISRALVAGGPVHLPKGKEWWADTSVTRMMEGQLSVAMANAKRVQEAGVTIAAGTDAGNPGTLHGPSIYRELALLRQAGLSPMEVLVAVTRNAARAMGREAEVGTLQLGKAADLVALIADPLEDVQNYQRVSWVMKGGVRVYERSPDSAKSR